MFKPLLISALFVMSSSLFAKDVVSTITCNVKEPVSENKTQKVKVEFKVKNLGSSKAELLQHPESSEDYGAILVVPNEGNNLVHLNGQGGDLRVSKDRIRLFGDGDGYTFVDLVLFKDAGYEQGYVRVYGSGDLYYQKLNCTVK